MLTMKRLPVRWVPAMSCEPNDLTEEEDARLQRFMEWFNFQAPVRVYDASRAVTSTNDAGESPCETVECWFKTPRRPSPRLEHGLTSYFCWFADNEYEGDGEYVNSLDSASAAVEYAKRHWELHGEDGNRGPDVFVRGPDGWSRYQLDVEWDPRYIVNKREDACSQ